MPKSIMSSPRARAAAFSSPVMLKTYGGSRFNLRNSCIGLFQSFEMHIGATEYAHIGSLRSSRALAMAVICAGAARFERDVDHGVAQIDAVVSTVV